MKLFVWKFQSEEKRDDDDDEDDVESNLLKPAGLMVRPATFLLKVYRAEDLPRSLFGGGDFRQEKTFSYFFQWIMRFYME